VIVDRHMEVDTLDGIVQNPNPWIHPISMAIAVMRGCKSARRLAGRTSWNVKPTRRVGAFVLLVTLIGALFIYWYSTAVTTRSSAVRDLL